MTNIRCLAGAKKYFSKDGCCLLIRHISDLDEGVISICISVEKYNTTWFARTYSVPHDDCDKSEIVFGTLVSNMFCSEHKNPQDTLVVAEYLTNRCEELLNKYTNKNK